MCLRNRYHLAQVSEESDSYALYLRTLLILSKLSHFQINLVSQSNKTLSALQYPRRTLTQRFQDSYVRESNLLSSYSKCRSQ